jgi:ubiquitin-like-conjugating enzyme ATG3
MSSSQDEREPTAIRKLVGLFHTAREYLNPVLKNSKFKETGVLTPEEFVAAGDFLVYKFPTWQWTAGLDGKQKDYLPRDKQYLITKNVPCLKRVKAMEYHQDEEAADVLDDEEGWVATHLDRPARQDTEIEDMEASLEGVQKAIHALMSADLPQNDSSPAMPNLDDIPDIEDELAEEEDPAALLVPSAVLEPTGASASAADNDDRILRTR